MKKSILNIILIFSTICVSIYSCSKDENGSDSLGNGNSNSNYALVDPSNCWYHDSLYNFFELLSIFLYVDSGPAKDHFCVQKYAGGCQGPSSPVVQEGIGTSDGPHNISFSLRSFSGLKIYYGTISDTAGYKKMIVRCPQDSTVSFYYSP